MMLMITLLLTISRDSMAISVMQIFSDRLHVAHCRAGCLAMMDRQEVMGGKVICDGVLCSILHAMSGSASPNRKEFISVNVMNKT